VTVKPHMHLELTLDEDTNHILVTASVEMDDDRVVQLQFDPREAQSIGLTLIRYGYEAEAMSALYDTLTGPAVDGMKITSQIAEKVITEFMANLLKIPPEDR